MKIADKLPRMTDWLLVTLALIAAIAALKPELLPVSLYKLSLITMAAVVGYWIDRSLFPYARPDQVMFRYRDSSDDHNGNNSAIVIVASMLRRAIIVGCAMLAVSLGM